MPQKMFRLTDEQICKLKKVSELRGCSQTDLIRGFMEPSCKVNMNRGFVEFNPNKVAGDKRFWRLLEKLAPCVSHASLKRYDLAYDIECARKDCRLSKDRRMYKAVISNGITEYLGVKNTAGYVKVYDKAAEMNLSGVLTRIELTCDGEWDAAQVAAHWPQVHAWWSDGADDAPPQPLPKRGVGALGSSRRVGVTNYVHVKRDVLVEPPSA